MRRKRLKERSFYIDENKPLVLIGFEAIKKELLLENNFEGLELILQKLLIEIRNRINDQIFDPILDNLLQNSNDLFYLLKKKARITSQTYKVIDLLPKLYQMELVADKIDKEIDYYEAEGADEVTLSFMEEKLSRIERLNSFIIRLFNHCSLQFPNEIQLPSNKILDFILEIENDFDFELLLIGLAQTKNEKIINILEDFKEDQEEKVSELAGNLLSNSSNTIKSSLSPNIKELKDLIAKDQIKKLLKRLIEITENTSNSLLNETYHQFSRYTDLEKEIRKGTISFENKHIVKNQIREALMEIINMLKVDTY